MKSTTKLQFIALVTAGTCVLSGYNLQKNSSIMSQKNSIYSINNLVINSVEQNDGSLAFIKKIQGITTTLKKK